MSIKQTYTLAHTAQCKLRMAAEKPDRNLRFLVGHAMHLDSLNLRILEIERGIEQPDHASDVRFKGAGNAVAAGGNHLPSKSPAVGRRTRSPPPPTVDEDDDSDDGDDGLSDDGNEDEEAELALQRFPSAAAQPHPPPLDPSDDSSSSSDEDDELALPARQSPDPAVLRLITQGKGDEVLANLYKSVKSCPCQAEHKEAPVFQNIWELPQEGDGKVRRAVAEVAIAV